MIVDNKKLNMTADFYPRNARGTQRKAVDNGRLFDVERVIACRRSKDQDVSTELSTVTLYLIIPYYDMKMKSCL